MGNVLLRANLNIVEHLQVRVPLDDFRRIVRFILLDWVSGENQMLEMEESFAPVVK